MNLQRNTKNKLKEKKKSRYFQIQRKNFDKCYIGQTSRSINIKFKQYIKNQMS